MVEKSGDQSESLDYYYFALPLVSTSSPLWYLIIVIIIKSHRFATVELFYFTADSKYNFHKITKCSSSRVHGLLTRWRGVLSTFLHTSIRHCWLSIEVLSCSYYYLRGFSFNSE